MATRRQTDGATQFLLKVLGLLPLEQDPTYPDEGDVWYRVDLQRLFMRRDGLNKGIAFTDENGIILSSQLPDISITDVFRAPIYTIRIRGPMLEFHCKKVRLMVWQLWARIARFPIHSYRFADDLDKHFRNIKGD